MIILTTISLKNSPVMVLCHCTILISSISFSSSSASYLQQMYITPVLFKVAFFFFFYIFCLWNFVFSHNLLFSSMQIILKLLPFWSFCLFLSPYFWLAAGHYCQYLSGSLCTSLNPFSPTGVTSACFCSLTQLSSP